MFHTSDYDLQRKSSKQENNEETACKQIWWKSHTQKDMVRLHSKYEKSSKKKEGRGQKGIGIGKDKQRHAENSKNKYWIQK